MPFVRCDSDESSESELEDGEEEGDVRGEDSDGENSDEDPDIFDWDNFEASDDGLSAWDNLGEKYEAEAATGVCRQLQY
jgi:hypothetical protein